MTTIQIICFGLALAALVLFFVLWRLDTLEQRRTEPPSVALSTGSLDELLDAELKLELRIAELLCDPRAQASDITFHREILEKIGDRVDGLINAERTVRELRAQTEMRDLGFSL